MGHALSLIFSKCSLSHAKLSIYLPFKWLDFDQNLFAQHNQERNQWIASNINTSLKGSERDGKFQIYSNHSDKLCVRKWRGIQPHSYRWSNTHTDTAQPNIFYSLDCRPIVLRSLNTFINCPFIFGWTPHATLCRSNMCLLRVLIILCVYEFFLFMKCIEFQYRSVIKCVIFWHLNFDNRLYYTCKFSCSILTNSNLWKIFESWSAILRYL